MDNIIDEIVKLRDKKAFDYGNEDDPMANLRASEDFGVPNVIGILIRLNDKMFRLKRWAKLGTLKNETARESLIDIAGYALRACELLDEEENGKRL
jgi:hypothetical protein